MEHVLAGGDAPQVWAETSWANHKTSWAVLQGRTGWDLLTRYAIGVNTIGSRGFIAAAPFGVWACERA